MFLFLSKQQQQKTRTNRRLSLQLCYVFCICICFCFCFIILLSSKKYIFPLFFLRTSFNPSQKIQRCSVDVYISIPRPPLKNKIFRAPTVFFGILLKSPPRTFCSGTESFTQLFSLLVYQLVCFCTSY